MPSLLSSPTFHTAGRISRANKSKSLLSLEGQFGLAIFVVFACLLEPHLDQELFERSKENRPRIGAPLTKRRAMGSKDCSQRSRSARNPFGSRVVLKITIKSCKMVRNG